MPTFKNVSGLDLEIPSIGVNVAAGSLFDIPDELAGSVREQNIFEEQTSKQKAVKPSDEGAN